MIELEGIPYYTCKDICEISNRKKESISRTLKLVADRIKYKNQYLYSINSVKEILKYYKYKQSEDYYTIQQIANIIEISANSIRSAIDVGVINERYIVNVTLHQKYTFIKSEFLGSEDCSKLKDFTYRKLLMQKGIQFDSEPEQTIKYFDFELAPEELSRLIDIKIKNGMFQLHHPHCDAETIRKYGSEFIK